MINARRRLGALLPSSVQPIVRKQLVNWRQLGVKPQGGILVSYPRSGSTWLRFLLGYLLTKQEMDYDSIRDIVPDLSHSSSGPSLLPNGGRMLRSHEPLRALTKVPSARCVVYLVRDGRQVARSYFHHSNRRGFDPGPASDFLSSFLDGGVDNYGSWPDHVLGAHGASQEGKSNMIVVRYEDLHRDPSGV